jgi:hypothetical protein
LILLIWCNKQIDKRGSLDALRDVNNTNANHLWDVNLDTLPVLGPLLLSSMIRMNTLYKAIMDKVHEKKF